MDTRWQAHGSRRRVLARGLAVTGELAAGWARRAGGAAAQGQLMTVSGAGVNLKQMPSPDGKSKVPLRESFAFDAHYAQCVIENNPQRFAMVTYKLGREVVEPHTFFMAMYANDVSLVGVYDTAGGKRNNSRNTFRPSVPSA